MERVRCSRQQPWRMLGRVSAGAGRCGAAAGGRAGRPPGGRQLGRLARWLQQAWKESRRMHAHSFWHPAMPAVATAAPWLIYVPQHSWHSADPLLPTHALTRAHAASNALQLRQPPVERGLAALKAGADAAAAARLLAAHAKAGGAALQQIAAKKVLRTQRGSREGRQQTAAGA